jgi:hypothetical protein
LQPVVRSTFENNWITLLLVGLFALIFLMKLINAQKLRGYVFYFAKSAFIEEETKEKSSYLHPFYSVLFVFSIAVFALIFLYLYNIYDHLILVSFSNFGLSFAFLFFFFSVKWTLEYILSLLFDIKNSVHFFLVSKSSYLFSITFFLFAILIVVTYTSLGVNFLINATIFALLVRLIFLLTNNKKLIFSKLFYFILYICTLEIAPLLILYKLTS